MEMEIVNDERDLETSHRRRYIEQPKRRDAIEARGRRPAQVFDSVRRR